jgi:membrane associated rhomboid family serine protease
MVRRGSGLHDPERGGASALDHRQPILNAPGVIVWLLTAFFAVHLLLWGVLPASENEQLVLALAFIPARIAGGAGDLPGGQVAIFTSFVTHQFVHGNLPHLIVNSAWLLALGSPIAQRTDVWRFLAFFVMCGIAGALVYLAINEDAGVLMVGASGSISGLMGAAFRFVFRGPPEVGASGVMNPAGAPLMSLSQTVRDRRIRAVIVVWTVLNVLLAAGAAGLTEAAGIAWEAHLGGFYTGLLLYGFFDRLPLRAEHAARAE